MKLIVDVGVPIKTRLSVRAASIGFYDQDENKNPTDFS